MSFWNSIRHLFGGRIRDDDNDADPTFFSSADCDSDDGETPRARGERNGESRLPSHHIPFPKY